ncbi:MAG: hypothetical protein ACQGVK_15315 [Myxococcota bacterium]
MRALVCGWVVLSLIGPAVAHGYGRGTFFVLDDGRAVVRISSVTARQQSVDVGAFFEADDIALALGGDIVASDAGAYRARDGVVSVVGRSGGIRGVLAERGPLFDPLHTAVSTRNRVFVAGSEQDLLRISPDGEKTKQLLDTAQLEVRGLALDSSDRVLLLVVDDGEAVLLRVDPRSGAVLPVSRGGLLDDPRGLAADCRDRVFTIDGDRRIVRVGTGAGKQKVVAEGDYRGIADLAADHLGDLLLSDPSARPARIRRLDVRTGEVDDLALGDLLDDPGSISVDQIRREEDPYFLCGARGRWTAREFLKLKGESLREERSLDLRLRLGAGAFQLRIGDELTLEGVVDDASARKHILTPDVPSQEALLVWLEGRLSDLRGIETRLRDREGETGPFLKLKLDRDRSRAEFSLRYRLEANTEPEILPVGYGLNAKGPVKRLPPLPAEDDPGDGGGGDSGEDDDEPGTGDNPGTGTNPGPRT